MSSSYDDIAGMYDAFWADWYLPAALPALEKLFFSRVPADTKVLDVCCGSGHVTKELVRRGYPVTGVDASAALIEIARRNLPGIDFRVQDARHLQLEERFDAALSTFDSLNHVLTLADLGAVFRAVRSVLAPGGMFVFDMNLEEAYMMNLREWNATVEDNSVGLVRGTFDPASKMAFTELIWFTKDRDDPAVWVRRESIVEQRCYSQAEITVALAEAGFSRLEALTAAQAGMQAALAAGRIFFSAYS
jgi:SAM-dependent methyltransferase